MMIDFLKNKNEKRVCDRLYIKSVNRCRCVKMRLFSACLQNLSARRA